MFKRHPLAWSIVIAALIGGLLIWGIFNGWDLGSWDLF